MKLFIPGPTWVHPDVLAAMAKQPVGHRGKEFAQLYEAVVQKLKTVLSTKGRVFLSTSSGSGVWELAARNLVARRAVCFGCGAFSDKWGDVIKMNGKECDMVQVEWGLATRPETVRKALESGKYDAAAFVYNETSTGLANPIEEIAGVMRDFPDVTFMVDAVSAVVGLPLDVDQLGMDLCLASVQKCFALPPGLAVFTVSDKAMEKAARIPDRGYYFDLLQFEQRAKKNQTITTPAIPLIYALDAELDLVLAEGMQARIERHRRMAELVRAWAKEYFGLFAEPTFESDTVTCIRKTKPVDIAAVNARLLAEHDCIISDGYGKLKESTFRIAHMGELTEEDISSLLGWLDDILW